MKAPPVTFQVANLDFYYGDFKALIDINIDIKSQSVTALIGPSGCGKSTFLRCLNRMNDTIPNTRVEGQILLDGIDIYAEDVDSNFAPSTGKILHHRLPSGPGIRVDRGIDILSDVSVYYDPMLSKVITFGQNREEAISRMNRALGEYQIAGVITNIHSFQWILNHPEFADGSFDNNFLDREFIPLLPGKWKKVQRGSFWSHR